MLATFTIFMHLLSCGPEDCDDLVFYVDLILDQQEDVWQDTFDEWEDCMEACKDAYEAQIGACESDYDGCLELVASGGVGPDGTVDTGAPATEAECDDAKAECEGVAQTDRTACEDICFHPDGIEEPYTKARHSPLISWSGGPIAFLSVKISQGSKKDDVVWAVKCPNENNCISSPVAYGATPDGTKVDEDGCADKRCDGEEKRFMVDGGFYKASGARDTGDKFPCVPKKENEFEFEFPNRTSYSYK